MRRMKVTNLNRTEVCALAGYETKPYHKWVIEDEDKAAFLCWENEIKGKKIMILDWNKWKNDGRHFKHTLKAVLRHINTNHKVQAIPQVKKAGTGSEFNCEAEIDRVLPVLFDIELYIEGSKVWGRVLKKEQLL